MKKLFFTIALIAIAIVSMNAQTFGVKAGVNFANVDTNDETSWDSKTGINLGFFVEFELSKKFMFQPELLFSTQGAKLEEFGAELKAQINYINLPLMLKFKAADKLYLEAGPQIGFLTTAKTEMSFDGETEEDDFKDETKSIDFGLNFGLSFDVMDNLSLGGRYSIGLINIIDEQEEDEEVKNSVFSIAIAYKFN